MIQQLLGPQDRRPDPQRQCHRVRGTRADLLPVDLQHREESALGDFGDPHRIHGVPQRLQHISHQVVSEWAGRLFSLQSHCDRGSLRGTDPDRDRPSPIHLPQQQHRDPRGHLDTYPMHDQLTHTASLTGCGV